MDRIIHPTDVLSIAGEAIGTVSGGNLAETAAQGNIVPGTFTMDGTTEDYTDDGSGVLTGSVSGVGTINYRTGAVTLSGSTNEALTADYDHFSPGATQDTDIANPATPMFMTFRSEGNGGGLLIQISSDGASYEQHYSRAEGAWWHSDIGLVPLAWLRVYSSAKGRLIGRVVNPT